MSAITNLTSYKSKLGGPWLRAFIGKTLGFNGNGGRLSSHWLSTGIPTAGATPSTAAACTSATTGALGQGDSSDEQWLAAVNAVCGGALQGTLLIADRLSHQGGLSGVTTGQQVTNFPTAALTRYTDGVGVWPCAEIYSAIGASGKNLTCSYTNQAGAAGQTSIATIWGGTDGKVGIFKPMPLAAGDTGARSVESAGIDVSTGTAGNWGVTLIKPLAWVPIDLGNRQADVDGVIGLSGQIPKIQSGACLMFLFVPQATLDGAAIAIPTMQLALSLVEGI